MNREENKNSTEDSAEGTKPSHPKWKKVLISLGLGVLLLVGIVVVKLGYEGSGGFLDRGSSSSEAQKAPQSAAEIIAQEFAGKIETQKVKADQLAAPPPGSLPFDNVAESREFEDEKKSEDKDEDSAPVDNKSKKSGRKIASVDKSAAAQLAFDKGGSKVSKNLDKKKVLDLLAKKLDKSCSPKLPDKTKSVKAEVKLSKSGGISNITVTPGSAEKELAKCMREKLADAKALKSKNKSVAQITVHFKVK